jgi:hypothetical protein
MKEFRFFFIVVSVMLLAMCFAYHSRLMPLLLVTVVSLCLLSFIVSLIARLRFTVEVQNGPSEVRRKDTAVLKIRIKNNFIMPLTPVRIYVKVMEKDRCVPQKKMLIAALAPFKEVVLNIQNDISYRGEYCIGFEKLEFFDILKLYRFTVKSDKGSMWNLISFPRELPMDNRNLLDENEEEPDVSLTKPHGFNKDAFAYLREYRAGESLRHIHWKLSARLNNLIVKQMEANHDLSSLIFLDFTAVGAAAVSGSGSLPEGADVSAISVTSAEEVMETSDTTIETAIAVTRGILLSGNGNNSAVLFWNDSRRDVSQLMEVAEARGYGDFVRALSTLPPLPYSGDFSALLEEFSDEIRLERAVYLITPQVTEGLVTTLRQIGLIYRSNVTLAVIQSPNKTPEHQSLLEYLRDETNLTILDEKLTVEV